MPEYLHIDPNGHVAGQTPAADGFLKAHTGSWRILPAHRDLMLLRRDQVGSSGDEVRAILTGDIEGMALGEMLAFLAQARWTGVMTVAAEDFEKSIFLSQGAIRWATSTVPGDRLGSVLQQQGFVQEGVIDRILRSQPEANSRLGSILISNNVLSAADLYSALKHQVQEIFFSVLALPTGLFALFNDPMEGRFAAQINLDLNGMLMEGLRRFDEMEHFKDLIPGPHVFVKRRDRSTDSLNEEEQAVFDGADGRTTLAELSVIAHLSEFDATRVVYGLVKGGYADVSEERPEVGLGQAKVELGSAVTEVVRVFNTIFREIFEEIGTIAPTVGFKLGVESFLESSQHEFQSLFSGLSLDDEGMLSEDTLIERVGAKAEAEVSDRAKWLSDGLNELMFFELFQAGEVLTPDRDDDLSRRVRVIYEMLDA